MKRKLSLSVVVFVLVAMIAMVQGCAMYDYLVSPDRTALERYGVALKFYNDNLEEYTNVYAQATPATKAEWNANIKPVFLEANEALDLWRLYINDSSREMFWNQTKQKLLITLLKYGVVEVK